VAVRFGVVYPQIELQGDPDAVRAFGAAAEELGYDHLLAYDHVLGAVHADREPPLSGAYTEDDPFHDPFVMFSYLAGRTDRLEFVTAILILPQRQTALVARQAADLALLSGDRLRLGVGTGWNPVEYDALGQPFAQRGARMDEQIELLRTLWSERVVSFAGRYDTIDRAALVPRPRRPVPIWIGGFSEPPLRRAARVGDGFIFAGSSRDVGWQWPRLQELLGEQGRPVEGFGAERVVRRDDPAAAVAELRGWEEAGGTHGSVVTMGLGFDSVDAHIDYIAKVAALLR
jgi:probable F420-dependent oxidoreductase